MDKPDDTRLTTRELDTAHPAELYFRLLRWWFIRSFIPFDNAELDYHIWEQVTLTKAKERGFI